MPLSGCVHRAGAEPDHASVIVTCVHGTWARGSRWPDLESTIDEALQHCGPIAVQYYEWSGRNSVKARSGAAAGLRDCLLRQIAAAPQARHVLVAHSHGANIVLHALAGTAGETSRISNALGGIVLLSPPLLDCEIVPQPRGAGTKLLRAAVAVIPLLIGAAGYARATLGVSHALQFPALAALIGGWLLSFRPDAVRRRADALARDLALPRIDFPGLVVRAPLDEATFALSSVSAFARVARYIWSRVPGGRSPLRRLTLPRLGVGRGFIELARTVFDALTLVPLSVTWLSLVPQAATGGGPLSMTVVLPVAVAFATAAIVIVGGSLVLLLLLPALSLLLWPFGVFPTPAAALLNVSVKRVPTESWQVVYLQRRFVSGWRHSVHHQRAALECVHMYLRGVFASVQHVASAGDRRPPFR